MVLYRRDLWVLFASRSAAKTSLVVSNPACFANAGGGQATDGSRWWRSAAGLHSRGAKPAPVDRPLRLPTGAFAPLSTAIPFAAVRYERLTVHAAHFGGHVAIFWPAAPRIVPPPDL